jgi:hypothetical protein
VRQAGGRKADNTASGAADCIMIHAVMSRLDSYVNIARVRYSLRNAD